MCPCVVGETQASVFTFHSQRSDLLHEERSEEPRMQDGAETEGGVEVGGGGYKKVSAAPAVGGLPWGADSSELPPGSEQS